LAFRINKREIVLKSSLLMEGHISRDMKC